jgi:hypothetical protein
LLLLCACKPTPTEEAVINRADGALEKAIMQQPVDPYTYEAPTRWEETTKIRNQEVRFSADIEVPDATQFPVVTIRQHAFTPDDITAFLQAVCTGDWAFRENELNREELTVELKKAAKGAYMGDDEETGEPIFQPMEEEMKRIQGLIEQAPVEDTFVPLDPARLAEPFKSARCLRDSSGSLWYFHHISFEGRGETISIARYRDGMIQMENWIMQGEATPGEKAHALENVAITDADAVAQADAVTAAIGLKNFGVADTQKARWIQDYFFTVYGEGCWMTSVQTLPGASPCFYSESSDPVFTSWALEEQSSNTFAPPWRQEHVQMFITENGLQFLAWGQPKETVMTANENVQLLPFAEIQKDLLKLIEFCVGNSENSPILVKRIVLTAAIAQIPDQGDEAFLVPTWAFFMTTEEYEAQHVDMQVLLINALDGTYICRSSHLDGLPSM